jgi:hypothetical protein
LFFQFHTANQLKLDLEYLCSSCGRLSIDCGRLSAPLGRLLKH